MSKKQEAPKKGAQLPATQSQALPAPIYDYGSFQGAGYEQTSSEDFAMPFLNVLQAMSPECGAEGPDTALEGAKPGRMLNSVTKEMYDRLIFVPVTTQHIYVEWRPRDSGGGIVARHEVGADIVERAKASSQKFGDYQTEEGNDLIETFYMIGYTLAEEDDLEPKEILVIPFWSTKIKHYKSIMQTLRTFKGRPPLFANRLLFKTMPEKNQHGTFYNFSVSPLKGTVGASLIPPTLDGQPHPLLVSGQDLVSQIQAGQRRYADETTVEGGGAQMPRDASGRSLF